MAEEPRIVDERGAAVAEFGDALLALDRVRAHRIANDAALSCGPVWFFENVVGPALENIGDGWERGRIALSQVYMSGRMCEDLALELLPPGINGLRTAPRAAIAVLEDYHSLGKRIVAASVRAAGFAIIDYGDGHGAAEIAARAAKDRLDVLMISALMLRSARLVADLRRGLQREGSRARVIVGGAPFSLDPSLADEVGADACGRSAADAVRLMQGFAGTLR